MEKLESYMVRTPQPCVYFAISDEEQMKIYSLLSSVNKNKSPNRSERVYFKVVEKNKIKEHLNREKTWFGKTLEEPTSILYCSDWQKYKVESSKSLAGEIVSDPNLVDIISGTIGVPTNLGKEEKKKDKKDKHSEFDIQEHNLIKITSKNLEKLIREDIDGFLEPNREINSKKTIPHKFMFLVILNKNIKNPNKVIGSLKSLDPGEVSAVCVACGLTDIHSKFEKLEQMIYETSLSYYEKKIKKITKNILNLKSQMTGTLTEVTELFYALQNFKIGYLSEFIGNRKEAYSKYITCWSAMKQMDTSINLVEKTSLSFYICLRTFDHYFFSGDIPSCMSLYMEYKEYLEKLILKKYRGLYYNIMYLVNYFIGFKLEKQSISDEKNAILNLKNSSYYYKWALYYLIELRKHINEINVKEGRKHSTKSKKIEEIYSEEEKGNYVKYHLPKNMNNVFFYEDMDYREFHDEKDYKTDEITEEELKVEEEEREEVKRIKESEMNLERESVELVMKNMTLYKNLNYSKGLLITYSMLGDSFYMGGNYKEALKIYLKTIKYIQYNTNFNEEYGNVISSIQKWKLENGKEEVLEEKVKEIKKEKEKDQIDYLDIIITLVYGELTSKGMYMGMYMKNISKVIVTLVKLLKLDKEPEILYQLSGLVNQSHEHQDQYKYKYNLEQHGLKYDDNDMLEKDVLYKYKLEKEDKLKGEMALKEEERMYRLILIKSLITFVSIYKKKNAVNKYLNYVTDVFYEQYNNNNNNNSNNSNNNNDNNLMDMTTDDNNKDNNSTLLNKNNNDNEEQRYEKLESYVLLCKNNKSQYLYKYEGEKVEIIVNFKKDVKIDLSFYEGFMDTSEGQLSFYFQKSEAISDVLVIYTNEEDEEMIKNKKMIEIPYNIRIIMIIQLPFYPVKNFKINGIILKGCNRGKMEVNAIMLTEKYVINNYFKMLDNIINLGYYTSKFDLEKHFLNKFNRYEEESERLVNLMYLSFNRGEEQVKETKIKKWINLDKLELMKILNVNMKQKIFIKNVVKNSMIPITVVFLYNKKFSHLYEIYKYQLKVTNKEFYVFGKREGNFVLHGTDKVEFDFRESIYKIENEESTKNIKLSRSEEQPKYVLYKNNEMNEKDVLSENELEVDPELSKYIEINKNNNKIYVMYGLINIGNNVNSITFNLFIKNFQINNYNNYNNNDNNNSNNNDNNNDLINLKDDDKELMDKKEEITLFQTKSVEIEANNVINVNVKYRYRGNSDILLLIILSNNTNITYDLACLNILYNNKILNIDNNLFGYKNEMGSYQNMNLMYLIRDYRQHNVKRGGENIVQIQMTEYIRQELNYPFKYMKQFLKYTINKFIKIEEEGNYKIDLVINHSSIVTLGTPFKMEARITNESDETMEYEITVLDENKTKERAFILEGPMSRSLVSLPRSSDTLNWTIVATRCTNFKAPVIRVVNKLDSSKKTEVKSRPSQIYVVP